ncbi:hypothetical protein [Microbacterium sp. RURRCA19A]|uniref:hypothetical protein n=1 Tax=Microbacterium sp. RURRCA19A TaxID=1907391 RepID=UPI000953CF7B|nr:hypothetical protein [Microbacterium sp. RURRCA19A]SIR93908.1 hypothetical protein SAMN05880568_1919 [Microbacterium sp. RURRCA19A]
MLKHNARSTTITMRSALDDRATETERSWNVRHARGFVIGVVVALVGFWVPVAIAISIWLSAS